MAVSPSRNVLFTCDPKLITQLLRNPAFAKLTDLMALLNLFGPTMTGTEGPETLLYRKIIAPFFHDSTMDRVFRDSVDATESFSQLVSSQKSPVDSQLRPMLSKLALHILGTSAFEKRGSCLEELNFSEKCSDGHKLSFADTFLGIDQDLPLIAVTPSFILKYLPLESHKRANLLRTKMDTYLKEAVRRKRDSAERHAIGSKSLLDLLVDAGDNKDDSSEAPLSQRQITGNIFIVNFAGHESNAHTIEFALLHLAAYPEM